MRAVRTLAALVVLGSITVACGGRTENKPSGKAEPVVDGTLEYAVTQDPGNLDPSLTALSVTRQVDELAYDTLLHTDANGQLQAQLAKTWTTDGKTVTYVLSPGITCADGSPLTATDVADNFKFIVNSANQSPLLGVSAPAGLRVIADDTSRTIKLVAPAPTPFLLESTADVLIVCRAGLDNRGSLAHQTAGTGPFVLKQAVANDHYVFARRDGYNWGSQGADRSTIGVPKTVNVRVVSNATTASNLLLTGGLNLISATGPDLARLKDQNLWQVDQATPRGLLWFNESAGRPGADEVVRRALIGALATSDVGKVLTAGLGLPSRGLITSSPRVCDADTVSGTLPKMSITQANEALDSAEWAKGADGVRAKNGVRLSFEFMLPAKFGDTGTAGTTLLADIWKQLGAEVHVQTRPDTALQQTLFATGAWDAAFVPLTVSLPSQLVPFLSGPGTNFAHIANAAYDSAVHRASTQTGDAACALWAKAEKSLISHGDVAPLVNDRISYFGKGVQFKPEASGIDVSSIRMVKE
jgi:peptide/nickel transport system substrate-binding protein